MPDHDKDPQGRSRSSNSASSAYNHGHEVLIGALMPYESVRFLEDDSEVRKWVSFDDDVYGQGVITYELLHGWWNRYRKGAIALFRDDRIDAIFAVWPLRTSAFRQILTGYKREKDIGPRDVLSESTRGCLGKGSSAPHRSIHFGDP